jgi:hypothetical protein
LGPSPPSTPSLIWQDILECLRLGRKEFELTQQFHHVFWAGDLNYRVELPFDDAVSHALQGPAGLPPLRAADQLEREKGAGRAFWGFREAPVKFAPTYKCVIPSPADAPEPSSSAAAAPPPARAYANKRGQAPSFTDRVLYYSLPKCEAGRNSHHLISPHPIPSHPISSPPIPYHTIPYHTIPYHTIPYHTIPSHPIPSHPISSHRCEAELNVTAYDAAPGITLSDHTPVGASFELKLRSHPRLDRPEKDASGVAPSSPRHQPASQVHLRLSSLSVEVINRRKPSLGEMGDEQQVLPAPALSRLCVITDPSPHPTPSPPLALGEMSDEQQVHHLPSYRTFTFTLTLTLTLTLPPPLYGRCTTCPRTAPSTPPSRPTTTRTPTTATTRRTVPRAASRPREATWASRWPPRFRQSRRVHSSDASRATRA